MADQKTVSPAQKVEIIAASGYRQIYANNVALRATNWDFLLDFGKIISSSADKLVVESEVGVYLSPQQAKALLMSLGATIKEYEKVAGEIPGPPK
jgi:hypothetical protein